MQPSRSSLSLLRAEARKRLDRLRASVPTVEESERAERIAAAKTNFEAFCGLILIAPLSGPKVPLRHNYIQSLFEIERTGRDIVLKPRQIGFTTLELARDLWTFLCRDSARVVVVCQSVSDNAPAKLLSGVLTQMIEGLRANGWELRFDTEAWNEWVLPNGNSLRITTAGASEAAAEKKGRSGTITRLHITELAFFEHAQKTLNALLECVPGPETGSEIVLESTPNGARGLFFDYCQSARSGKSAYKWHFYPWFGHPNYQSELRPGEVVEPNDDRERELVAKHNVTPEQLKWRRLKLADKPLDDFDQEYPDDPDRCFIVSGKGYFDKHVITLGLTKVRKPIETREHELVRIFALPDKTRRSRYVLALDTSAGEGGDPAAGILLDVDTGQHMASIDGQLTPARLAEVGAELAREYNGALIAPERNNHGHAVLLALGKLDPKTGKILYGNVYEHHDKKEGFPTDQVTRPSMLSDFEDSFRKGLFKTPDQPLLGQMRTFVVHNGKPQAASGCNDDLVMAAAIAWTVRQSFAAQRFEQPKNLPALTRFSGGRGYG